MRIGITGSSRVTYAAARASLKKELTQLRDEEYDVAPGPLSFLWLHHGDCVMADEMTAEVARRLGYKLHCHPPIKSVARAYVPSDEIEKPLPYLVRNRVLVDEIDTLIALPEGPERTRSDTWSTVRYARRHSKRITIIGPDGTVTREN